MHNIMTTFADKLKDVEIIRVTKEKVKTRTQLVESAPEPMEMIPLQMTMSQVSRFPEGMFTTEDYRFYHEADVALPVDTVIRYKGERVIKKMKDPADNEGVAVYYTKPRGSV